MTKQLIPIGDFHLGNKNDKPLTKNSAVNVIYFTNKCNLACTYCYEDLANRPPQIMSKDDIVKYVDDVIERESNPNTQTLFVLFGGEVTLEWENACFLMEYAFSKKTNVVFNMETNGIKFLSHKFINEVKDNFFYKNGRLSLDVSFDGIGNQDRIFHNGMDSTNAMIQVFKNLDKHNIRYRIRYTIQKNNIDFLFQDINNLINTFKAERIITSIAWDTLDISDGIKMDQAKEKFREAWINKTINIPICELFCDMCNGCGERKDLKAYYSTEGNVAVYKNRDMAPKFDHFKDKE